jgi:hypothetical protein
MHGTVRDGVRLTKGWRGDEQRRRGGATRKGGVGGRSSLGTCIIRRKGGD